MSVPFQDRRAFCHNLSYDVTWQDLKDHFKDLGCEEPFVDMFKNPRSDKPVGGAVVEFKNQDDLEKAVAFDGNEFKGRKMWINKDNDNFHIGRFANRVKLSFRLKPNGRPELCEMGHEGAAGPPGGNGGRGLPPPRDFQPQMRNLDRRVFCHNLNYDVTWQDIKDHFKDMGCQDPFVEMFKHPRTGKSVGGGIVEFRNNEDLDKALTVDGQEFKGRKMWVNKDNDDFHIQRFVKRIGVSFRINPKGKPELCEVGEENFHSGPPQGRGAPPPRGDYPPAPFHHGGPPPHHGGPPPHHHGPPPNIQSYDPKGKPLVNDVEDLLLSTVFFSNFPWKADDEEIMRLFETVGCVRNLDLMKESEEHEDEQKRGKSRGMGLCEFERARDAHRAIIMLHNSSLHGREVHVRMGKEKRSLPEGLSQLGRPLPEVQCADICHQELNIDPFAPAAVFIANIPFDVEESVVQDVFSLVGETTRCVVIKKDGKSRGIGVANFSTGYDAQQAMAVLNDAHVNGRQIKVRLDRESEKDGGRREPQQGRGGHMPPREQHREPYRPPMDQHMDRRRDDRGYDPRNTMPQQNMDTSYGSGYNDPPRNSGYDRPAPPPRFGRDEPSRSSAPPPRNRDSGSSDPRLQDLASSLGINSDQLSAFVNIIKSGPNNSGSNSGSMQTAPASSSGHRNPPPSSPAQNSSWGAPRNGGNSNQGGMYRNNRDRSPIRNAAKTTPPPQSQYRDPRTPSQGNQGGHSNAAPKQEAKPDDKWQAQTKDTIYLRNIPAAMSEVRLRYLMSNCGNVSFIDLPLKHDNTPVGYAYVRFDGDGASRAVSEYDNYIVDGMKLEVGLY